MMETVKYTSRWFSNEDMARVVDAHPDRFLYQPNLSPAKYRGVQNVVWEMEYWVKEKGARIFKYYPPEDTYMNDPELWPMYEKAEELGIVFDIHTGFSWVPPGKSKYALPIQLDDIARDFPELTIVAFHMGYPYCDDLNMVAMSHPNVYPSISLLVPWALSAPENSRGYWGRPFDAWELKELSGASTLWECHGNTRPPWKGSEISSFPRICRKDTDIRPSPTMTAERSLGRTWANF